VAIFKIKVGLLAGGGVARNGPHHLRQRLARRDLLLIPLPGIKRNQPGDDDDNAAAPNNPNPVGFNQGHSLKK